MKTALSISRIFLRLAPFLALGVWLAGCATGRVDWNARVGHYTYDQAVTEMGPPNSHAKLTDGVIVAEWLINRGTTYVYGTPGPYGYYYGGPLTAQTMPGRFLRLTFGANGQLAAWKKVYR
jgi:hypothetical protein